MHEEVWVELTVVWLAMIEIWVGMFEGALVGQLEILLHEGAVLQQGAVEEQAMV